MTKAEKLQALEVRRNKVLALEAALSEEREAAMDVNLCADDGVYADA